MASRPDSELVALDGIRESEPVKGGLYLSTCNRVEILFTAGDAEAARQAVVQLLARIGNLEESRFASSLYTLEGAEAVAHVFRVASSLDSLVVGEPQILGQIKQSYTEATRRRTSGVILNRLMHRAFHVAKRVRTETEICDAAVSISYAAVELAKKIFYPLEGKKTLLIGAGEMAELAARHLIGQGVTSMAVANRTFDRAVEIARRFRAHPVSFDELETQLREVDIVIASTAAPGYVISYDRVKDCLRKRRNRPLFFIDIAVPKDVDPRVNELQNVYLYDIDDLKGVVEMNVAQRREEAVKAERIVKEEVVKFQKWMETLDVVPTIVSLREKADEIVRSELKKSRTVLAGLSPEQQEAVQVLTSSVTEKILNDPILYLKRKAGRPTLNTYLDVTRKLFNLDKDRQPSED